MGLWPPMADKWRAQAAKGLYFEGQTLVCITYSHLDLVNGSVHIIFPSTSPAPQSNQCPALVCLPVCPQNNRMDPLQPKHALTTVTTKIKTFFQNYTNPHWSNNVCSACISQHRTDLSHLMTRNQMRAWDERLCFVVCTHWDERFLDIKHIIENQQINQMWLAHIRATKIQIQIIRWITWIWLWINGFKFHMNPDYPLKNDQMNYRRITRSWVISKPFGKSV